MLDDARIGHPWLPKGVTGFYAHGQAPLPSTNRKSVLRALHAIFRGVNRQVGTAAAPHPARSYWYVRLTDTRSEDVLLLVNEVHPLAGFARPETEPPEFLDRPDLADQLSHDLVVVSAADLTRAVTPEDLEGLAEVEREQIRYWRARTFGEIIFNEWD